MSVLLNKIRSGVCSVVLATSLVVCVSFVQNAYAQEANAGVQAQAPESSTLKIPVPNITTADEAINMDGGNPALAPIPVVENKTLDMTAVPVINENDFYDSQSVVPSGEMGANSAPRKMNPRTEPASTLIVVEKTHSPSSREASLVAADRAMKLARYESALSIYDRLYDQNRRDPNILLGRASALQQLGRVDEAISMYERVLDQRPDNLEAQINMLGLMSSRYPSVAMRRLMDLQERYPDNDMIAAQIALSHAQVGQYNEAMTYLGMAASMQPNNPMHYFNLAVIADRLGAKKEAVQYYERALEVDSIYAGGRAIPRDAVFDRLAKLR